MLSNRTSMIIKYFLVGLISLSIGIYFRLYPLRSYSSEDSSEKATLLVLAKLRQTAEFQIDRQNPQMEKTQRNLLAKQLFNELLRKERNNVNTAIDKLKFSLDKKITKKYKTPYLLEADPFYYYGLTEKILKTGRISDDIKGGKFFNPLLLAPLGHWVPLNLHPYIGCFIYKTFSLFNPHISLMHAVSFTPLFIITLSLIPFLIILFLLKIRPAVAFTVSIFYLLSPILMKRSLYGWYDNDPYNTFFPFTIICLFFFAVINIKNRKKVITYGILMSLLTMLYSYFWHGWMFLFCILIGAMIVALVLEQYLLKNTQQKKNTSLLLITFLTSTVLVISMAFGIKGFLGLFIESWDTLKNFLTPQLASWPDLFIGVGELHNASVKTIVELTGGFLFFGIALIGLLKSIQDVFLTIKRKTLTEAQNFFIPITLIFLWLVLLFLSLGAQRFALLAVIPLSVLFAIGLEKIFLFIMQNLSGHIPITKKSLVLLVMSFVFLLLSLIPIISTRSNVSSLVTSIYNDTWDNTMRDLREETPEESIVTAWWPPGHFITGMAKRRVTFDGATINVPQAYWLAHFFLSKNETEALGVLRMLNDSGNKAAEYLQESGLPLSVSVKILKEILPLSNEKAFKKLRTILPEKKAKHLLSLTHQKPPASYCLLYNELIEKNIQLSFLGNWDFKKIETINADPENLKKIPPRNSSKYIDFLWQISGGMPKYSGILSQINKKENNIIFSENIYINLDDMTCRIASNQYGKGIPYSLFYLDSDGKVTEKEFSQWTLPYSVVLIQDSNQYGVILMDRSLAQSLFIQLYFFDGKGLKYFKPFSDHADLTKRTHIKTFEVNWEQFYKDTESLP